MILKKLYQTSKSLIVRILSILESYKLKNEFIQNIILSS